MPALIGKVQQQKNKMRSEISHQKFARKRETRKLPGNSIGSLCVLRKRSEGWGSGREKRCQGLNWQYVGGDIEDMQVIKISVIATDKDNVRIRGPKDNE